MRIRSGLGLSILLGACAVAPIVTVVPGQTSRTFLINGAPLTISLNEPGVSAASIKKLFVQIRAEATTVDNIFFATGALELLNNQLRDGTGPVRIQPRTGRMIADAMRGYEITGGIFDATVGPLIVAWVAAKGEMPAPSVLRHALARTGSDKLVLSRDYATLNTRVRGMRLEPGGMRDGWVVKRVSEMLSSRRLVNFMVNFRGSCWYANGVAADDKPWKVLVSNHRTQRAGYVYLTNQSLSVSVSLVPRPDGKPGKKGHIVDPRNGYMVRESRSVIAVAPSPLDAEILSTATVVLGSQAERSVARVDGGSVLIFYGKGDAPLKIGTSATFTPVKSLDDGTYFQKTP
jgi:thiamine biosynthesis lipoprotein ApbE